MSLFGEEKRDSDSTAPQHPEQRPENNTVEEARAASEPVNVNAAPVAPPTPTTPTTPPANEYWVRNNAPQRPTTPSGYGQGYPQPPQQPMQPPYQAGVNGGYNPSQYQPMNYQGAYPPQQPQYRPAQYQYSPNSGWQQPQAGQAAQPGQPGQAGQTAQQPKQPESYQWNFQDYDKAATDKPKKKKSKGFVAFAISLACVLALGLISISAYGVYKYVNDGESFLSDGLDGNLPENPPEAGTQPLEIASKSQISESVSVGGKLTIPQAAKAVLPSVVGVVQYRPNVYLEQTGAASGIIMSEDGYIITNAHVVEGGTDFKVILADGDPKDAELIGYDTVTDLAVLKAKDVSGLTPAVFGNSEEIEVGETVIAIGNPGGTVLAGSVTQGIISAVNRKIPSSNYSTSLIQTDAAINPGNSGGALVNEYGQVIGINSAKIVADGYEGICFAIPISEAKPVIDSIVENGRVVGRVKIGIQGREIDEVDARKYGLQMGIRIQEIDSDSDLINKGVQKFDIITDIDDVRIYSMLDLRNELAKHKPGDQVTLKLFRQVTTTRTDTLEITITLIEDR